MTGWVNEQTSSYTLEPQDVNMLVVFNSATAVTLTLPQPGASNVWLNSTFRCLVSNIGAGTLTVAPTSSDIDGSASSLSLTTLQGLILCCDGTNFFTVRGT